MLAKSVLVDNLEIRKSLKTLRAGACAIGATGGDSAENSGTSTILDKSPGFCAVIGEVVSGNTVSVTCPCPAALEKLDFSFMGHHQKADECSSNNFGEKGMQLMFGRGIDSLSLKGVPFLKELNFS